MKFSDEVSQAGVRNALRPWSLTNLPFALAINLRTLSWGD